MEKWLKEFLKDEENQEYINNGDWERLYGNLSFLMNTDAYMEVEDAYQLTSILHDAGIMVLNDPDLKSLPNHMFYGCKDRQFTILEIPNNITSIGVEAFTLSESIRKVILPKSLKEICSYAFSYCEIEELHYPGTEKEFYDNVIMDRSTVFEGSGSLKLYFDGEKNGGKVKIA